MLRRFSTYSQRLALSRARPASASTRSATAARPAARPVSARTARPAAASATNGTASSSGAPSATAAPTAPPTASESAPRLVPNFPAPSSAPVSESIDPQEVVQNLPDLEQSEGLGEDWTTSFQGLGSRPFEPRVIDILMAPVVPEDVEVTPDGLIYLPEIKYRRILNRAFGPGGWGIAPRTKTLVTKRQVTREYGLVCLGRLVSVSRGEMDYFSAEGVTTAMEGCKSNALMRCCKDLGIASELWDPSFIRTFKAKFCESKYYEKKRRFVWKRKDRPWEYPYNQ